MKILTGVAVVLSLVATPAMAATRPQQAIPMVQKLVDTNGKRVKAASETDRNANLIGLTLLPVLLGVVAVITVVVVVTTRNQSNG